MQTILITEDDRLFLAGLADFLTQEGFSVKTAVTARKTVESVAADSPDLVILDVHLEGGGNGFELCRLLRRRAPLLPIILMSGMDVPAAAELASKGPTVFLSKPFFASQVRELVERQLGAIT